jgi:hypothetical protein
MIVVVEIAVDAALVTSIGEIKLNVEWYVQPQSLLGNLFEKAAHREPPPELDRCEIGCSEIFKIS